MPQTGGPSGLESFTSSPSTSASGMSSSKFRPLATGACSAISEWKPYFDTLRFEQINYEHAAVSSLNREKYCFKNSLTARQSEEAEVSAGLHAIDFGSRENCSPEPLYLEVRTSCDRILEPRITFSGNCRRLHDHSTLRKVPPCSRRILTGVKSTNVSPKCSSTGSQALIWHKTRSYMEVGNHGGSNNLTASRSKQAVSGSYE